MNYCHLHKLSQANFHNENQEAFMETPYVCRFLLVTILASSLVVDVCIFNTVLKRCKCQDFVSTSQKGDAHFFKSFSTCRTSGVSNSTNQRAFSSRKSSCSHVCFSRHTNTSKQISFISSGKFHSLSIKTTWRVCVCVCAGYSQY